MPNAPKQRRTTGKNYMTRQVMVGEAYVRNTSTGRVREKTLMARAAQTLQIVLRDFVGTTSANPVKAVVMTELNATISKPYR